MKLSLKHVGIFALLIIVAYAPTFLLAGSIDGDEWIKSGAGALGLAVAAFLAKILPELILQKKGKKADGNE